MNRSIEHEKGTVAPFEKNLEVWRQLWRVVEKSDVLVQIVDSRNPLLFRSLSCSLMIIRCPDVDKYVKEVHPMKRSMLIVNKADLIPEHVRIEWGRYFDSVNLSFVFFSAKASSSVIEKELEKEEAKVEEAVSEQEETSEEEEKEERRSLSTNAFASLMSDDDESEQESEEESEQEEKEKEEKEEETKEEEQPVSSDLANYDLEEESAPAPQESATPEEEEAKRLASSIAADEQASLDALHCTEEERHRYRIHDRDEVLATLERETSAAYEDVKKYDQEHGIEAGEWAERRPTVGMLGFPNVGKSSLINVLLGVTATSHGSVRVAVGATPGKTKHLQTCILSDSLMLCDCPGLVFPVFMNTKADLLFNGILPASNMREYIGTTLALSLTPRPHSARLPARPALGAGACVPYQAASQPARPSQRRSPSSSAPPGTRAHEF